MTIQFKQYPHLQRTGYTLHFFKILVVPKPFPYVSNFQTVMVTERSKQLKLRMDHDKPIERNKLYVIIHFTEKIAQKLTNHSNPEVDGAMRSLRKRLKREQRRRRAMALRRKHAGGDKPAEAMAPAAG